MEFFCTHCGFKSSHHSGLCRNCGNNTVILDQRNPPPRGKVSGETGCLSLFALLALAALAFAFG